MPKEPMLSISHGKFHPNGQRQDFSYFYCSDGLQGQSNPSANKILVLLGCSHALQAGTLRLDNKYGARTVKVKSKNIPYCLTVSGKD